MLYSCCEYLQSMNKTVATGSESGGVKNWCKIIQQLVFKLLFTYLAKCKLRSKTLFLLLKYCVWGKLSVRMTAF